MKQNEQSKGLDYETIKKAKETVDNYNHTPIHRPMGRHLLIELYECKNFGYTEKNFEEVVKAAGCTPLKYGGYRFEPQGSSAFMILSESHFSVHTYPEHRAVFADLFTCGDEPDPYKAMSLIKQMFQAEEVQIREVKRGI